MTFVKKYIIIFLILLSSSLQANTLVKGFEALKIYDYFKARTLFIKSLKKHPAGANYGLAEICISNQNPFYDLDSARVYLERGEKAYLINTKKENTFLKTIEIDDRKFNELFQVLYAKAFDDIVIFPSEAKCSHFLFYYPYAPQTSEVKLILQKAAFEKAVGKLTISTIEQYIKQHPDAPYTPAAYHLLDSLTFEKITQSKQLSSYEEYIEKNPEGKYISLAWNEIWKHITQDSTESSYTNFLHLFPTSPFTNRAWEALYEKYTRPVNQQRIAEFINKYPANPLADSIALDIEYCKEMWFPTQENNKWAYVNHLSETRSGKIYDWCGYFENNLAKVEIASKTGMIDKKKHWIIKPRFDEIEWLGQDYIVGYDDNNEATIFNAEGMPLFSSRLDNILPFENNIAPASVDGKYGFINTKGEWLIKPVFGSLSPIVKEQSICTYNEKMGVITPDSIWILQPAYDLIKLDANQYITSENGKHLIFSMQGNQISKEAYTYIGHIQNGLRLAVKGNKIGYIDSTTTPIIPFKFENAEQAKTMGNFSNDRAFVFEKGRWGIINKKGELITKSVFTQILPFQNGVAAVKKDSKWGYVSVTGKFIISPKYDLAQSFSNQRAIVQIGQIDFLIDQSDRAMGEQNMIFLQALKPYIYISRSKAGYQLIDENAAPIVAGDFTEIRDEGETLLLIKGNAQALYYLPEKRIVWKSITYF